MSDLQRGDLYVWCSPTWFDRVQLILADVYSGVSLPYVRHLDGELQFYLYNVPFGYDAYIAMRTLQTCAAGAVTFGWGPKAWR